MSALLRLRGLPFTADEGDVQEFFGEGFKVENTQLLLRNAKPTGEAYVQLGSAEEAQRALKERQHEHIGSRYIEIFEAVEAEVVARSLSGSDAPPTLSGHVVRLRGLPFTSTAQDVVEFLSGLDVLGGEAGVLFTCTPDGRPTGEAYLEVASETDVTQAQGRHKEKMGPRYIEVFPSSKAEMFQAVQQHGFFTAVGGRRKHHWHQQHGGGSVLGIARKQQAAVDSMSAAFAGFGLSQRDMQVPGPPRYGYVAYGASPDERHYAGRAQPSPASTAMSWRSQGPPQQQHGMQMRPQVQGQFNPAPGPPGKPGSRPGMGPAQGPVYEYGAQPAAIMVNPFMVQHPFVMSQQQGGAWGAGMMAQQAGGWYGGRGGMQMGQMAGGPQYYAAAGAYYAPAGSAGMQRGMPSQSMAAGSHGSQHSGSRAPYTTGLPASQPPPPPGPPPPPPADARRAPTPAALLSEAGDEQARGNGASPAGGNEGGEEVHRPASAASPAPPRPLSARSSPVKLLPSEGEGEWVDLTAAAQPGEAQGLEQ